jgi:hypothetical protein
VVPISRFGANQLSERYYRLRRGGVLEQLCALGVATALPCSRLARSAGRLAATAKQPILDENSPVSTPAAAAPASVAASASYGVSPSMTACDPGSSSFLSTMPTRCRAELVDFQQRKVSGRVLRYRSRAQSVHPNYVAETDKAPPAMNIYWASQVASCNFRMFFRWSRPHPPEQVEAFDRQR